MLKQYMTPKQYIFEIHRVGKPSLTLYKVSSNDGYALRWLFDEAQIRNWGELDVDWEIHSITSRSLSEVYEHNSDKVGYLCELTEELFAREVSNNCPNTELRGLTWNGLCDAAIEMLNGLKGKE